MALAYRTSRSSGYGYDCRTELQEVPGTGMNVLQNLQKFFVAVNTSGIVCAYPTEHDLKTSITQLAGVYFVFII